MVNKEELQIIEKHLKKCKGISLFIAEHDNDRTTAKVMFKCNKCNNTVSGDINREMYIDHKFVACPTCEIGVEMAVLNIRLT